MSRIGKIPVSIPENVNLKIIGHKIIIKGELGVLSQEISDKIKNSSSVVWFEYQGLTVSETNELRRLLRETDSDFKVYKNTLVTRALKDLEIELNETLEGPKAIAFGKS